MDITIHASFLPHDDPDAFLAFYRDILGFEVRGDVGNGKMRWITVGPADQPGTSIVLDPPSANPGLTDDERRTIAEMMAKGTYAMLLMATKDLDGTFERLQASDAEVVQEPTEQPYGVRDCAVRDPAGNLIRIQELTGAQLASLTTRRDQRSDSRGATVALTDTHEEPSSKPALNDRARPLNAQRSTSRSHRSGGTSRGSCCWSWLAGRRHQSGCGGG
jgi:catechol 2,3-dioxygenase-like lactoylglutathione lyase family enzyme